MGRRRLLPADAHPARDMTRAVRTILPLAMALVALGIAAQATTLRLVSTAWPPFTNEPGQARFALDLVETAMDRIGIRAATTIVAAAEFTPSLLGGSFDGSAAAWKDPDRDRALLFSEPYLENRLILVGRRGADVSASALPALTGKRIAIVEGYSYGDVVLVSGPTFVRSRSEEDSLELLLASRVDYTLMDELVVQYIVDYHASEARTRLQIGSTPLLKRQLHVAVRRTNPEAGAIVDRFNGQLRTMIADRTYHRLLHVGWILADVDGDGVPEYVPASDRQGPDEPRRAYMLFADQPDARSAPPRYYFGGTIYSEWASVPAQYKIYSVAAGDRPDPARSTASVFTFKWR
jgi:polar amino acid transport system substrate-binding protein